jgi:mitochondrial distribution and morphology protein 34
MLGGSRGMLAAHQPLVVPMLLRLSHFVLNAYVVLVVSKQKGITLVFKTDPLQNVDVNSTFDSIAVIQKYIQREIEGQLREMFRDDLPGIIHRLSQRWVAGQTKVEAPYLFNRQRPRSTPEQQDIRFNFDTASGDSSFAPFTPGFHPSLRRQSVSRIPSLQRMHNLPSPRSVSSAPAGSVTSPVSTIHTHEAPTTFPEIENFDPTYGLRPDDLPAKSGYSGFGRLFGASQGLKDLAEEPAEHDTDGNEADSFDMVDWEETVSFTPPPSIVSDESPEYETIPAVGGGTITRPRIYHSQSIIRPPTDSGSSSAATITNHTEIPANSRSVSDMSTPEHDNAMSGMLTPIHVHNAFFPSWPNRPGTQHGQTIDPRYRLTHSARTASLPVVGIGSLGLTHRSLSSDINFPTSSSEGTGSHPSRSSSAQSREPFTPPSSDATRDLSQPKLSNIHTRRRSVSPEPSLRSWDGVPHGSPPNLRSAMDADGHIVLRPGLNNNTISQLSTLSHSNHTLSPYTRSLEHFTVRSVPHRASGSIPATDRQPAKAKRKRTYYLGRKKPPDTVVVVPELRTESSSPPPPSEFEVSDVEHYFRLPQNSLRRKASHQTL